MCRSGWVATNLLFCYGTSVWKKPRRSQTGSFLDTGFCFLRFDQDLHSPRLDRNYKYRRHSSGEEVMAFADSACYSAKAHGRGRVEVYDIDDESRRNFVARLRGLPRSKKLSLPTISKFCFNRLSIFTRSPLPFYEVLVRLPSDGKLLLPGTFLPAAERFKLIPEIDRQGSSKLCHTSAQTMTCISLSTFQDNLFAIRR